MFVKYWWGSHKERVHKEDQDVGGSLVLKWILERYDRVIWIGLIWLRIRTIVNTVMKLRAP
jgi:hypothetical protein